MRTHYFRCTRLARRQPLETRKPGEIPASPGLYRKHSRKPLKTQTMFNAKLAGHHEIDNHQLRTLAPSVFAGKAHSRVSDRYAFLPTSEVVSGLRGEGWAPVWAGEQRIRLSDRKGFQKHMIRFARVDDLNRVQAERPELVLVNSHDRSSAYQLHAGIFRFVCSNGMILADSVFARISIMHVHFDPAKVIEASFNVVREMPRIADLLEGYKARTLSTVERRAFGEAALILKYDELAKAPVSAEKILTHRRSEDAAPTLWNTLNVVQENMMDGGQKDYSRRRPENPRRFFGRTRPVKGLDENVRLNKALWHLADTLRASEPLTAGHLRDHAAVSLVN
jgi:hypothetical protein